MEQENKNRANTKIAKILLVNYTLRKASYMVRLLAGGYLVYLMYQLFSDAGASGEELSPIMVMAGILLLLAGVYFVVGALYALAKGIFSENDPGKLPDTQTESVEEKDED